MELTMIRAVSAQFFVLLWRACLGRQALWAFHGQRTSGGIDDKIDSTLPPVFRPKIVPRS